MAGEVEESFSLNFQVDSIHSGSISFGRFEKEPLSWARRSSFSHNRYLEEVEKCSKPGSVIEKKAYFEAHFKKGIFGIHSSASHNGSDRTTSENGGSERASDPEDFESNEDGHHVQFDQRSQGYFEPNENGHSAHFDESPDGSEYHGKRGLTEWKREDTLREGLRDSFSNHQIKSDINNPDILEDVIDKNITLDEAFRAENEIGNTHLVSVNDESTTEMKKNHGDTVNTDESLRTENMTVTEAAGDGKKTTLHDPIHSSPKETMPELGVNSSVNNGRIRKSSSSKSSKDPSRSLCRENLRRTNMEKNISNPAILTPCSVSRTPKEISRSGEKVIREIKSEKVSRVKKASESQPSVLKADSSRIPEAKRLNCTVKSTKSDHRPTVAPFNFKSSERAERRKEEMKDAEIKNSRKMKAATMSSFYRTALPSQSDRIKAVSNNTTSKKVQKLKCQGTTAEAASLPSKSKAGNDEAANKSVALTGPHGISVERSPPMINASEASVAAPPLPTNQSCLANNQGSGKKEQAKATKGVRRHSNEQKQKGEPSKYSKEMGKKGVRSNNGVQSSSRIANLPAHVAS